MEAKMCRSWENFAALLFFLTTIAAESNVIVQTDKGAVQGKFIQSASGKDVFAFEGIPYAKPPVGELRFEPPQPVEAWTGVRDATKEGAMCTQLDGLHQYALAGEEDCLFLNVFSRELPSQNSSPQKPVLFWIHGGAFLWGSSSPSVYGPQYLLDKDIVLVTINYRVGILGFLSTGDEVCPGNMGLKDQLLALKWVKTNIAAFGGDPNSVTIFGESAGGASVHYHMLSPASRGLFQKAITHSGSALNNWAFTDPEVLSRRVRKAAEIFGCPEEPSSETIDCLRSKEAADLIQVKCKEEGDERIPFTPTVEKFGKHPFMKETPFAVAQRGEIAPVPWINGITASEGAFVVAVGVQNPEFIPSLDQKFDMYAALLYGHSTDDIESVTHRMRNFYFNEKPITSEALPEILEMYSDATINYGSYKSFRYQLPHQKALMFSYLLTYRGKSSFTEFLTNSTQNFGVSHADDLMYLFSGEIVEQFVEGEPDKNMSNLMVQLWTDFARTGNPTSDGQSFKWKSVSEDVISYLDLKLEPEMKPGFAFQERMEFWDSISLKHKLSSHDEF